jgi:hypothetical protein
VRGFRTNRAQILGQKKIVLEVARSAGFFPLTPLTRMIISKSRDLPEFSPLPYSPPRPADGPGGEGAAADAFLKLRKELLVLLCPAWRKWGSASTVEPNTIILRKQRKEKSNNDTPGSSSLAEK